MPLHRNPQSLKRFSYQAITLNLELLCYGRNYVRGSKALADFIHAEGYKAVPGPFVDWPSSMLEELLEALYRHRCGHQHLLHCVIQPQLSRCSILLHGSIHVAMNLLTTRCNSNLKHLELNHSKNVPAGFYSSFFTKFNNLTYLSIYNSLVDDMGFRSIGKYMPHLVELNAGRTWMTNTGVKYLCLDEEQEAGRGEISVYRCPRLVVLNITGTRVTPEGVALFVACHSNAIRIEHEETFHGFSLAQRHLQMVKRLGSANECSMTSLMTTNLRLVPEDFDLAIGSCPRAEEITILSSGLNDESLYRLMNLSRLSSLHLGNKNALNFNFYQGVAPVLDVCGKTLKKLVLEEFSEVDVQLIGRTCLELEHLALSGTTTYAPVATIQPGLFTKLKKLELWNKDNRWGSEDAFNRSICSQTLKQILLYSDLDFLLVYKVDTLTDGLVSDILSCNQLRKLKNVVLDHCQGFTSVTLWKLLESPNQLSVLRCWNCGGVPVETRDEIKQLIKDENLILYWEWYPYNENEDEIAAALAAAELAEQDEDSEEE